MKFLLKCTSSDENLSWCQYALVLLNDVTRIEVENRRASFTVEKRRDDTLWDQTYWGIPGEFYDDLNLENLLTDDQQATLESQDWLLVPDDFVVTEEAARTECDRMVINDDGFYWKCIVKHTSVYIETAKLPYGTVM